MAHLIATQCPICLTDTEDEQVYKANFTVQDLDPATFSPRRIPDQKHYQMVLCRRCGLIRANPVLEKKDLQNFYTLSHLQDEELSSYAAETYIKYFLRNHKDLSHEVCVLEIGCGSGFFLKELLRKGFVHVQGIEPSLQAASQIKEIKDLIKKEIFGAGLLPQAEVDIICAFHVFDHLADPVFFLDNCRRCLKDQGELFLITHDIHAWPATILGENCPMVDIEHPFLYDQRTLTKLLQENGFEVKKKFCVYNRYPLRYWVSLMPAPKVLKKTILAGLNNSFLGRMPITLGLGNMGIIARKKK